MQVRPMLHEDLDFALAMTSAEGWTSTRRDFEELLEYDPLGCFIGEIEAEPIGMVCAVSYQKFGFVGNLIVDKSCRGQQCGRTLMEHAMRYLQTHGAQSILLDGVPEAVTLYERLGFRKICRSLRLEGVMVGEGSRDVRPMRQDDLTPIARLDASLFGGRRDRFLRMRYAAYPEYCKLLEIDDEIHGYIMGSTSGDSIRIGPWAMMKSGTSTERLLLGFAQDAAKRTLKAGVLENNTESLDLLHKYGFKEVSFSWRMICGRDTEATLSTGLYAICCPARG